MGKVILPCVTRLYIVPMLAVGEWQRRRWYGLTEIDHDGHAGRGLRLKVILWWRELSHRVRIISTVVDHPCSKTTERSGDPFTLVRSESPISIPNMVDPVGLIYHLGENRLLSWLRICILISWHLFFIDSHQVVDDFVKIGERKPPTPREWNQPVVWPCSKSGSIMIMPDTPLPFWFPDLISPLVEWFQ